MIPPLAMHMANELLSVPMAAATMALAAAFVALAAWRARRTLDVAKLPLMGVMGAFVFAAQMINFPVLPGTSGHLVGSVLLSILLGPWAAILTITSILIVQCLLFADGGLLALGCNIINMGVVPAVLGGVLYRVILGPTGQARAGRQYLAAYLAALLAVVAGASLVPVETSLSGVLKTPVWTFMSLMAGVHVIIGCVEGLVTFAVLAYLRQVRPELVGVHSPDHSHPGLAAALPAGAGQPGYRAVLASLLVTALLLAGVLSWFACSWRDGLESCIAQDKPDAAVIENDDPAIAKTDALQGHLAAMPDYSVRAAQADTGAAAAAAAPGEEPAAWPNVNGWGSLAGLVGTAVTLGVVYCVCLALRRKKKAPVAN